jgi:hypothetical protein
MTLFAVRAQMLDGGHVDLLLFLDAADAEAHCTYIREHARLLGYDLLEVVRRRAIGKGEEPERRRLTRRLVPAIATYPLYRSPGLADDQQTNVHPVPPPSKGRPGHEPSARPPARPATRHPRGKSASPRKRA